MINYPTTWPNNEQTLQKQTSQTKHFSLNLAKINSIQSEGKTYSEGNIVQPCLNQ